MTGYGHVVDGKIPNDNNGRVYDPKAQPRIVNIGGQTVRWILRKRKAHQHDPDEVDWVVGSVTVCVRIGAPVEGSD